MNDIYDVELQRAAYESAQYRERCVRRNASYDLPSALGYLLRRWRYDGRPHRTYSVPLKKRVPKSARTRPSRSAFFSFSSATATW